jgi:hypothetical protein
VTGSLLRKEVCLAGIEEYVRTQESLMISVVKNRGSISGIGRRAASAALALAVVLVPAVVATRSAQAQTFSVLHSFTGAEGGNPDAGLIRDAAGNLYGTTPKGGAHGLGTFRTVRMKAF